MGELSTQMPSSWAAHGSTLLASGHRHRAMLQRRPVAAPLSGVDLQPVAPGSRGHRRGRWLHRRVGGHRRASIRSVCCGWERTAAHRPPAMLDSGPQPTSESPGWTPTTSGIPATWARWRHSSTDTTPRPSRSRECGSWIAKTESRGGSRRRVQVRKIFSRSRSIDASCPSWLRSPDGRHVSRLAAFASRSGLPWTSTCGCASPSGGRSSGRPR